MKQVLKGMKGDNIGQDALRNSSSEQALKKPSVVPVHPAY